MPLTRFFATAAAIALTAAVSAADMIMITTNAMPSSFGGMCKKQACKQGVFFANALSFNDEFDTPTFSYAVGEDFKSFGWAAGPVTIDDAWTFYQRTVVIRQLKLRGVTILRMMNAMVGSPWLTGNNDDAIYAPLLQYNNVRVKYSTTLPATNRLLSVEVKDPVTGEYKPIDRTALYTVNSQKSDYNLYPAYNTWTASPSLTREGVVYGNVESLGSDLLIDFLKAKSPYTIPNVSQALTSEAGGTAMVVEQDAAMCKTMTPPHKYDAGLASCVPCPPDSTSTGTECDGAAASASPAVSSAAGSTGAVTASSAAPTSAPATPGADTAGVVASGATAPSSGSSMRLIIAIVVAVVWWS